MTERAPLPTTTGSVQQAEAEAVDPVCHLIELNGRTLCGTAPRSGHGVHSLEACHAADHPFCVLCTALEVQEVHARLADS